LKLQQLKNETILILGGNGFLGASITRKVLNHSKRVHLVARESSNLLRIKDLTGNIEFHIGDLTDSIFFSQLIKSIKPTIIYYTVGAGSYNHQPDREFLFNNNLLCAHNLLMATISSSRCRIIYAGTSLEQGKINQPMNENGAPNPISCYGAMKAATNIMMMQAAIYENRAITVLNPFAIYGVGEPQKRLIPTIIQSVLSNKELDLTTPGNVRDYIFVDDVADAFLLASITSASIAEKINIANGVGISNEQVVSVIEKLMQTKIKVNIGTYEQRITDTNFWCADISKAKQILGWQPKHTLEIGLKATIDWMTNEK
jgi:nucleoside-diphosphate-sugar epimerase